MTFQSPLAWPSKASVVCRWANGEAFANASAAKPVFRKTAETLPRQFLERLDIVNSNPDCAYRLESAVLFGSMLSEAERLGDVDIASNCSRRSPRRRNFGSGVTGADKPRESRGNSFRSSFDIFNAESKFGSVADYERYTRPYDKRVFEALTDTKLTILHLHYLERPYLGQFKDFNAPVIQYSVKTSGIPISDSILSRLPELTRSITRN
jgi:hypothetical protein